MAGGGGANHAGPRRAAAGSRRAALITSGPALADVVDVAMPVDGKGKTTSLSEERLVRGERLLNAACSSCHVGGGTRT